MELFCCPAIIGKLRWIVSSANFGLILKECFVSIYFVGLLIGMEGARLLRDKRSGETLKGAKRQVAHRLPRGKRAAWNGNQLLSRTSLAFRNRDHHFQGQKTCKKTQT
ncbi:hypothetical protein IHV10_18000 [Fictibacillus sp. 5RED26]|uniref:hypothetical protein n=1 Tax=Fictibacillus sp. 5RED26 TaxID=2745876 RepID=UPI0018CFD45D|nr:hypothetical protein [Fictibacillus sp. 5RED26]MBH0158282.1 hypothetical protein [Fictibacillus sp. 5RED26]